jgi:hypothetical protein
MRDTSTAEKHHRFHINVSENVSQCLMAAWQVLHGQSAVHASLHSIGRPAQDTQGSYCNLDT